MRGGPDIAAGFYAAIDRAEHDPAIRAIVLTGRGQRILCRCISRPAEIGRPEVGESMENAGKNRSGRLGRRATAPIFVTTLRKPIIAAINGPCVGIGLTLALMCDVRFAAAGAKFAAVIRPPAD